MFSLTLEEWQPLLCFLGHHSPIISRFFCFSLSSCVTKGPDFGHLLPQRFGSLGFPAHPAKSTLYPPTVLKVACLFNTLVYPPGFLVFVLFTPLTSRVPLFWSDLFFRLFRFFRTPDGDPPKSRLRPNTDLLRSHPFLLSQGPAVAFKLR